MATEKELGYEPSLLIEMVKHRENGRIVNRALVEKDRTDTLNGMEIDKPDFASFLPHFQFLNIGGSHFESMENRDSREMFADATDDDGWPAEKRSREVWCEEIKALLIEHGLDGTGNEAKQRRVELLKQVFSTGSWTRIENMRAEEIKAGYEAMKVALCPPITAGDSRDAA